MRDEALALLRKGIDPTSKKQEDKAARKAGRSDVVTTGGPAFKDVAKDWLQLKSLEYDPGHYYSGRIDALHDFAGKLRNHFVSFVHDNERL